MPLLFVYWYQLHPMIRDHQTNMLKVWVLSFLSFGYATEEFEVTEER